MKKIIWGILFLLISLLSFSQEEENLEVHSYNNTYEMNFYGDVGLGTSKSLLPFVGIKSNLSFNNKHALSFGLKYVLRSNYLYEDDFLAPYISMDFSLGYSHSFTRYFDLALGGSLHSHLISWDVNGSSNAGFRHFEMLYSAYIEADFKVNENSLAYMRYYQYLIDNKTQIIRFGMEFGYAVRIFRNQADKPDKVYSNIEKASEQPFGVRRIELTNRKYVYFPAEIYQFKNLEYLNLDDNNIAVIPEGIDQLVNLTVLELRNNQIISIPPSLKQLKHLEFLYLDGNPINELFDFSGFEKLKGVSLINTELSIEQQDELTKKYPEISFRFQVSN